MIGNIIILGIAVSIILYAKKVFLSDLARKPAYLWSAIVLCSILLFSIILPNIAFVKSPFTPEVNVKVIDSITKEPISGAAVIVDWGYESSSLEHHSSIGVSTSQQIKITDAKGVISAEKKLRCLAIDLSIIYRRSSGGVGVIILNNGYKLAINDINNNNYNTVYMAKPISKIDKDVERSNLMSIKEMAKRRYKKDVSDYVEQIIDSIANNLYLRGE